MGVQQQLLEKLGQSLVMQFRDSIEQVRASGRTSESIHAVATDYEVEVLADRHIWALEDGRKPTSAGATRGNPTLYERIKEWMQYRSVFSALEGKERDSVAWAITKKIHEGGTALYRGVDHYGRTAPSGLLTNVIKSIDEDSLLRELIAYQATIFEKGVIKELEEL